MSLISYTRWRKLLLKLVHDARCLGGCYAFWLNRDYKWKCPRWKKLLLKLVHDSRSLEFVMPSGLENIIKESILDEENCSQACPWCNISRGCHAVWIGVGSLEKMGAGGGGRTTMTLLASTISESCTYMWQCLASEHTLLSEVCNLVVCMCATYYFSAYFCVGSSSRK